MADDSPPPPAGFKIMEEPAPPAGFKVQQQATPQAGGHAGGLPRLDLPGLFPTSKASQPWGEPNKGLDFTDKVGIAAHDTTDETKLFLEKRYGKGSVKLYWGDKANDGVPRMTVKKDGREIEVKKDVGMLADTTAESPMLAGMAAGGAAGAELGSVAGWPGALIGGAAGAGIGAAAGYTIREGIKEAGGTRAKTPEMMKQKMGEEFVSGAVADVGGKAVGAAAGKLMTGRLPRMISGVTDESRDQFMKAKEAGAMPHWATSGPDLKKLARVEIDATKLVGRYQKQFDANRKYVMGEVQNVLEKGGMPRPYVAATMDQIKNTTSAFSGREVGQMMKDTLNAQAGALEEGIAKTKAAADEVINPVLGRLDRLASLKGPEAAEVEKKMTGAWGTFKAAAADKYDQIHNALGGAKVVPTAPIREAAEQILSQLPKSAASSVTKDLASEFGINLPEEGNISLKDAQRIRTILRERGKANAIQRNTTQGDHIYLSQAVDDAIDLGAEDPSVKPFVKAFRGTNQWYKDTKAKFDDATIKKLMKLTRTDTPPSAEQVTDIISGTGLRGHGKTSTVGQVRTAIGADMWKKVQSQDLANLIKRVSSIDETGARTIDGMKLLDKLSGEKYGALYKEIHGEQQVSDLMQLGKVLAARGGKLSPEALEHSSIKDAISKIKDSEKQLDGYLNKNLLAELRSPTMPAEQVYDSIIRSEDRTAAAFKALAGEPEKQQALQHAALAQLARHAEMSAITDFGKNAMGAALNSFTESQQRLLFPKELPNDIRELDKIIRFIYPQVNETNAAGIYVGSVLEKKGLAEHGNITKGRWYIQATKAVARWIALNPTVMQYILHGLPLGPKRKIIKAIATGATSASIMGASQPDDTQDVPEGQQPP